MNQSIPPPRGPMENALELFSSDTSVAPTGEPRLNLLLEREPAHKTFISNLRDAFQPAPLITRISLPGDLWHDVFLPTAIPWKSFQESLLWHFVVIFAGWALTQGWVSRPQPHVRESSYRSSGSIYYSPSKVFPSARSSPPKAKSPSPAKSQPAARAHGSGAMPVAAENRGAPKLVVPPDLKLAEGPRAPNLTSSNPTMPSVPLSATSRAQGPLGGMNAAIAPPPEVKDGAGRLSGLAQTAVAPPADLVGMGGRRALRGPGASVVEPPPSIQGSGRGMGTLGPNHVVAPPPQLPGEGLRAGVGLGPSALASGASGVVAPPPSVEHSGRPGLVSGPGVAVVPPAPAAQAAGLSGGLGRGGSPGGVGPQVVPPPPSVQSGGGVLGALSSLFSGGSSKVVPPPPTLQGSGGGGSGEGSRIASLGDGSTVVPPPPAMQAGGGNGKGRITSLGSGGSEIVPPPPTLSGAGGAASGRGGLGGSATGGGSSPIAPPPSLSGLGNGSGKGFGSGRQAGGISGNGTGVVPPPPSVVAGSGNGGGGTERFGALAGTATQVVPPPPGLQGTGNGSRGNGGALMAGGGGVVAPPPSIGEGAGSGSGNGSGAGGRAGDLPGGNLGAGAPPAGTGSVSTGPLEQMEPLTNDAPPATPSTESAMNVPLRLVGVPVLSSKTSFFSNYEVFIAERRVNQTQTELIKLVYVFLPYQKRLSEYDLNTTKVYKLRVIKDPRCDESLMSMTWPEGDQPDPETQAVTDKLAAADKNTKLPCYHTTADDFQHAIAH
jgi:hypothetical protein